MHGEPLLYKDGVGKYNNENQLEQEFTCKYDAIKKLKMSDKTYKFDRVELEKNFGDIRPDAIGYINDVPHLIEFWHTHKVDVEKAQKIIKLEAICIEIKVQTHLPSEGLIKQFLSETTEYRNYIYPVKIVEIKKEYKINAISWNGLRLKNTWTN